MLIIGHVNVPIMNALNKIVRTSLNIAMLNNTLCRCPTIIYHYTVDAFLMTIEKRAKRSVSIVDYCL